MTRIYYTDAYCRSFDARVVRAFTYDGRPAVTLDRTAFYPTSGGQPFDLGALGDVPVVDVVDVEGDVVHVLSSPLPEGAAVRGQIDWARRFDHMQQHTGQHVLSAALVRVCNAATVSFHLGSDVSTIDLSAVVAPADVERAVDEANRIVWADEEVAIRFASDTEAKALPLRKESARQGELRLVEVPGFDLSACGGTHVARTGAIGAIAVAGTEKFKGGLRLTFVCGGRVVRTVRQLRDAVAGSVRVLSVLPHELPAAVEKLQADGKNLRKTIASLQTALAVHEADRLLAASPSQGDRRVITEIYEGWDAAGLKTIASSLVARDPVAVVLVAGGPSASGSWRVPRRSALMQVSWCAASRSASAAAAAAARTWRRPAACPATRRRSPPLLARCSNLTSNQAHVSDVWLALAERHAKRRGRERIQRLRFLPGAGIHGFLWGNSRHIVVARRQTVDAERAIRRGLRALHVARCCEPFLAVDRKHDDRASTAWAATLARDPAGDDAGCGSHLNQRVAEGLLRKPEVEAPVSGINATDPH